MKNSPLHLLVLGAMFTAHILSAADEPSTNFQKIPDRPVDLAHDKNLYVIGYSHLDTQ
ncbi:MAG: hypothetical protein QM790_19575 [Nibricoccus sp.]